MATVVHVPGDQRFGAIGLGLGQGFAEAFEERDKRKKNAQFLSLLQKRASGSITPEDFFTQVIASRVFDEPSQMLAAFKFMQDTEQAEKDREQQKAQAEATRTHQSELQAERLQAAGEEGEATRFSRETISELERKAAQRRTETTVVGGREQAEIGAEASRFGATTRAEATIEAAKIGADARRRAAEASEAGGGTDKQRAINSLISSWGVEASAKNRVIAERVLNPGTARLNDRKLTKIFSDHFNVDFNSFDDRQKQAYIMAQNLAAYRMTPAGGGLRAEEAVAEAAREAQEAFPPEEFTPRPTITEEEKPGIGERIADFFRGEDAAAGAANDITSDGTRGSNASVGKVTTFEHGAVAVQVPDELITRGKAGDPDAFNSIRELFAAQGITNVQTITNILQGLGD